eukprot:scaffold196876_cov37-Tisochrysis_lutea.AAC.1
MLLRWSDGSIRPWRASLLTPIQSAIVSHNASCCIGERCEVNGALLSTSPTGASSAISPSFSHFRGMSTSLSIAMASSEPPESRITLASRSRKVSGLRQRGREPKSMPSPAGCSHIRAGARLRTWSTVHPPCVHSFFSSSDETGRTMEPEGALRAFLCMSNSPCSSSQRRAASACRGSTSSADGVEATLIAARAERVV